MRNNEFLYLLLATLILWGAYRLFYSSKMSLVAETPEKSVINPWALSFPENKEMLEEMLEEMEEEEEEKDKQEKQDEMEEESNHVKNGTKRVLILTASRSGSTFLLDMMSLMPGTFSVNEPLRTLRSGDAERIHDSWEDKNLPVVDDILTGLLECNQTVYESYIVMEGPCPANSTFVVIKTISLRGKHVGPLLRKSDIKVINLLRDPRARYQSMKTEGHQLPRAFTRLIDSCPIFETDLDLYKIWDKRKLRTVRYEDIVADPVNQIRDLYKFIGADFTPEVEEKVKLHSGLVDNELSRKANYNDIFNTMRNKSFNHDRWRQGMTVEEILKVEEGCGSLIKKLNYKFYNETL